MAPGINKLFNQQTILDMSIPEPNSGCWLWLGNEMSAGYGRFKSFGVTYKAHQASYILFNGFIPRGMLVRHSCHNKLCVNPEHLKIGNDFNNAQDQVRAGLTRSPNFLAGRKKLQQLTDTQKDEIREKYKGKRRHATGGITYDSLAIEYGVTIKVIWRVINNGYAS